jgi:hypothetical protein
VPEHAEYVAGAPFGPTVPVRLARFGRVLNVSRQSVLRDDVASFGQLQQALGVAAASIESDVVYGLLTSNPLMGDRALKRLSNGRFALAAPTSPPPFPFHTDAAHDLRQGAGGETAAEVMGCGG